MQRTVEPAWRPVLDVLIQNPDGMSLADISGQGIPLDKSTIHRHLAAMVDAGLAEKTGLRKQAKYRPRQHVSFHWLGSDGPAQERRWFEMEWESAVRVDWRFPLVSRVPDELAVRTLNRFFEHLWVNGWLTPWLKQKKTKGLLNPAGYDEKKWGLYWDHARNSRNYEGFSFVVFGSCATGEAREESDVDVLLVGPSDDPMNKFLDYRIEEIRSIMDEINLGAARPIDLHVVRRGASEKWPRPIREAVLNHGITVLSTVPDGEFIESLGAKTDGP